MTIPPIAALEIGTTKVRVVVAEAREDGQIMITGLGETPSRGVRKADIIDFDIALACARRALEVADKSGPVKINEVHLVLSGGDIRSEINKGTVPVQNESREVTQEDMEHCMETARAVVLPPERQSVHTICQRFLLDDSHAVLNPIGMECTRLSVDMLLLHGIRSRLRSTVKVVRSVPLELQDVAFGGLCAALAVLSPEQKEKGVLVIDIGGGTTDYVVYAHNAIAWAGSFAVGGDHITNDVARGLRVSGAQAERLKEQFGNALVDFSLRAQKVAVPADIGTTDRFVPIIDLHTVIHVRIEEILRLVKQELDNQDLLHLLGAGAVLVGGTARLPGLAPLAAKVLGLHCAVGRPRNMSGLASVIESPEYAATLGMIRYGFSTAQRATVGAGVMGFLGKVFGR